MDKKELLITTTPRLHPEIPVLNLGHEHPSKRVVEVVQAVEGYGEKVVEDDGFCLVTGPALTSHHPVPNETYDLVLWVGKYNESQGLELPWGEENVVALAQNQSFWHQVEQWIELQRQTKPDLRFFLLLGHPLNHPQLSHEKDDHRFYHMGMQSLPSIHGHLTALIDRQMIPLDQIQTFDPQNPRHLFLLSTFLTTGWESFENFNDAFESTNGSLHTYASSFQLHGEEYNVNRPFIGFPSFSEAFKTSVEIQQAIKDVWLAHAIALSEEYIPLALNSLQLHLKQSCIPNMTLLSLSKHDQEILGVNTEIKAAIFPFNLANPQSLLDGILLDRAGN
ncbi:MAG: hypothetical protein UX28_C0003G0121 [Candidatus Pacebacteria bacterium GW2011_GWA1_46_10]|nr:MAG: hypothetical protein UX28_C0003G0121 [Candidatus Pacebacteria bacterium GW2011_GWA1_46_10]